MSDIQNFVQMLNKSKETFSKEKSSDGWMVIITSRKIEFYFNKDGDFQFCATH